MVETAAWLLGAGRRRGGGGWRAAALVAAGLWGPGKRNGEMKGAALGQDLFSRKLQFVIIVRPDDCLCKTKGM